LIPTAASCSEALLYFSTCTTLMMTSFSSALVSTTYTVSPSCTRSWNPMSVRKGWQWLLISTRSVRVGRRAVIPASSPPQ